MKHSVFLRKIQTILIHINDEKLTDIIKDAVNLFCKYPLYGVRLTYKSECSVIFEVYRYNVYASLEIFPDYEIVYLIKKEKEPSEAYDGSAENLKKYIREMMSLPIIQPLKTNFYV